MIYKFKYLCYDENSNDSVTLIVTAEDEPEAEKKCKMILGRNIYKLISIEPYE